MEGSEHLGTDELVSRLNKHLVRNTADDRFATFFYLRVRQRDADAAVHQCGAPAFVLVEPEQCGEAG